MQWWYWLEIFMVIRCPKYYECVVVMSWGFYYHKYFQNIPTIFRRHKIPNWIKHGIIVMLFHDVCFCLFILCLLLLVGYRETNQMSNSAISPSFFFGLDMFASIAPDLWSAIGDICCPFLFCPRAYSACMEALLPALLNPIADTTIAPTVTAKAPTLGDD